MFDSNFLCAFLLLPFLVHSGHSGSVPGTKLLVTPELELTLGNYRSTSNRPIVDYNTTGECHSGIWTVHQSEDYRFERTIQILFNPGPVCTDNEIISGIQSVRYVGLSDDINRPFVSLFSGEGFAGDMVTISEEEGVSNITFAIESVITMSTNVELFQEIDYQGDFYCLDISFECNLVHPVCWAPWLYDFSYPWSPATAKSAKAGCSLNGKVVRPQTVDTERAKGIVSKHSEKAFANCFK